MSRPGHGQTGGLPRRHAARDLGHIVEPFALEDAGRDRRPVAGGAVHDQRPAPRDLPELVLELAEGTKMLPAMAPSSRSCGVRTSTTVAAPMRSAATAGLRRSVRPISSGRPARLPKPPSRYPTTLSKPMRPRRTADSCSPPGAATITIGFWCCSTV